MIILKKREFNPNDKIGNFIIIKFIKKESYPSKGYKYIWECKCECGNIEERDVSKLNANSKCWECVIKERIQNTKLGTLKPNDTFGDLTLISFIRKEQAFNKYWRYIWKCQCSCGNIEERDVRTLTDSSKCKECSSKFRVVSASNKSKEEHGMYKHGDCYNRFYDIYTSMKYRCENKNNSAYKYYGALGIKCLWTSYLDFKNDMYDSYLDHVYKFGEKDTTLDRIDVFSDYSKNNCRWATRKEQIINRKCCVKVICENNKEIPLISLCEELGLKYKPLYDRYYRSIYKRTGKIPYSELIRDSDIV